MIVSISDLSSTTLIMDVDDEDNHLTSSPDDQEAPVEQRETQDEASEKSQITTISSKAPTAR